MERRQFILGAVAVTVGVAGCTGPGGGGGGGGGPYGDLAPVERK